MRSISFRRLFITQAQRISHWKWVFASVACAAAAGVLSVFFKSSASRALLPLVCLVLIVVVAMRYGARAGIIGSVLATVVFAFSLFPPLGQFRIDDPTERANVVWMFLGGISLSYLLSSDEGDKEI
jgi:K+-sensing histidine kinase KdpD